jgi:pimeloyl-ACP methyl ester carboxylesterase
MVAVTLPGFGGTPAPDLPMTSGRPLWHRNAVDALSALLDRNGLDDVVVVGHSWGGDAAVQLAAARPDRVSGLVLLDSWPVSDRSWFEEDPDDRRVQAFETVAGNGRRYGDLDAWQAFNGIGRTMDPERRMLYHGWFMATPRDVVLQYWAENSLTDMNPLLDALGVPVLDVKAVAPGADRAQAVAARKEMWDRNGRPPGLRTVYLDDTTHHVLEHRPGAVDDAVAAFLAELGAGGGREASPPGAEPGRP